jgi:antitoxin CptB|tara:strand:+ start:433 stop:690 length:258 start_codon:yes stop_codon:yes gene_type:complete
MSKEINRIHWKCRRGMREIDLLLREFSKNSLENLNNDDLLLFEEILNYDDQSLYDFIFKQVTLSNNLHEKFILKHLTNFTNSGNF